MAHDLNLVGWISSLYLVVHLIAKTLIITWGATVVLLMWWLRVCWVRTREIT
jgi:hypothetical protein